MEYTIEQKEILRNAIVELQQQSGLSANAFAVQRLGFTNGSKFSHVVNSWNKDGLVGDETWSAIEKYIKAQTDYKIVATSNLMKVWNACELAYSLKKACPVIGDGGSGKSCALEYYKIEIEKTGRFTVYLFDASMTKTRKQFIEGLMQCLGCYKIGTIDNQLIIIKEHMRKQNALLLIDEISSLHASNVVIIKDVLTALKDICGVVLAGTPYFMNILNKGAAKDKHLFSETRDRLFMLTETLEAPTDKEAELIFKANGIIGEALDIVMGRNLNMKKYSILAKRTFRGINDCIGAVKYVLSNNSELNIQLGQIL